MTGRALAVFAIGVLLVAALAATGIALLRGPQPPDRIMGPPAASLAPEAESPREFAQAACVRLRLATQGISAGSAADTVRSQLAAARVLAAQALRGDGSYAALSGALAVLDEAVRRDDAAGAAVAAPTALAQCDEVARG